jgi:hypothetical protein
MERHSRPFPKWHSCLRPPGRPRRQNGQKPSSAIPYDLARPQPGVPQLRARFPTRIPSDTVCRLINTVKRIMYRYQCCRARPFWYGSGFFTDPDPHRFLKVMFLKRYFLFILTWFSFSVSLPWPNQQAYLLNFPLQIFYFVQ